MVIRVYYKLLSVQVVAGIQQRLQFSEREMQSSEREKVRLRQQLTSKEAELIRAEEAINREQQQRQQVSPVTVSLHVACFVIVGLPDCRRLS